MTNLTNNIISFSAIKLFYIAIIVMCINACSTADSLGITKPAKTELIYLNEARLRVAQQAVEANDPFYVNAYNDLIKQANQELKKKVDPVTNKTVIPASGDIHDYHTLSPYHWPDPSKADGLPWVYKDGQFNPTNRGPATDFSRRKAMLKSLNTLNLAFYHSRDTKYLTKAKQIVHTWFVNPKTKMNPNINYGQAIPGKASGTCFAIIDWTDIGKVITTLQLLEQNKLWEKPNKALMDTWLSDYYTWLTTSEHGIRESTRTNNHSTNYDYQLIGLMLYLGNIEAAEKKVEQAKKRLIAAHIEPDGSQPRELKRTKSVNYTVNNLWALVRIADLSRRHTHVDLWSYTSESGVSLKTGYDFVVPFITKEKTWPWRQIIGGGAQPQLINLALPMFSRTELMLGETILPSGLNGYDKFTAQEVLTYAPYVTI